MRTGSAQFVRFRLYAGVLNPEIISQSCASAYAAADAVLKSNAHKFLDLCARVQIMTGHGVIVAVTPTPLCVW